MARYLGIDVYQGNGVIDWDTVKPCIDFAMLKAGQGQNHVDSRFDYNALACERLNIPYGAYWFINATTVADVILEADKCIQTLQGYNLTFPVAYDFEKTPDEAPSATVCKAMAREFLNRIRNAGYIPMLYTNVYALTLYDYQDIIDTEVAQGIYEVWFSRGFSNDMRYNYPLLPTHENPNYSCGVWQWGYWYNVPGIPTSTYGVDADIGYKDYGQYIPPRPPVPSASRRMPLWMMLKNN